MKFRNTAFVLAGLLGATTPARAQVPQRLSISGALSDADGAPIVGQVQIRLSLYGDADGGAALATESFTVDTETGDFAVELGRAAPLDLASIAMGGQVYLGVQIGDDPEMTPRLPFNTALYAQRARRADEAMTLQGAGPGDFALATHTHAYAELTDIPATFPPAAHTHDFSEITGVPADLADGDDDTFAGLSCADGESPVRSGGAWACRALSSAANAAVSGAENDGTASALRVTSSNDTMLIDGDEIDSDTTLRLQTNSQAATLIGGDLRVNGDIVPNRGATPPEGLPGRRLHRYFSTIEGARRARNVSVNEVNALCGDADGCSIVLIERGWDANRPDLRRSTGVVTMYYEATTQRFSVGDGSITGVAGDRSNLHLATIGQCTFQADWGNFPFAIRSGTAATRCYISIED